MSAPLSSPAVTEISTRLFGDIVVPTSSVIAFPEGLPGFPFARRFALLPAASRQLRWLQSLDHAGLAFLLVEWAAIATPLPEFSDNAYAIVTLPGRDQPATANFAAPVLIDPDACSGQQVIRPGAGLSTAGPIDLEAILRGS